MDDANRQKKKKKKKIKEDIKLTSCNQPFTFQAARHKN
jgi:hypothetical protein